MLKKITFIYCLLFMSVLPAVAGTVSANVDNNEVVYGVSPYR